MPYRGFRRRWVHLIATIAVALTAGGVARGAQKPDIPAVTSQIVAATNDLRRAQGRADVAVDATLERTAREFAAFMAQHDEYSHEADGRTAAQRVQGNGYAYCVILENIASSYSSAGFSSENLSRRLVEGWKGSPPHRANMLDASATQIGVGVARSEESGTFYAVQLLGRPRSQRIAFDVRNDAPMTVRYLLGEQAHSLRPGDAYHHEICRSQRLTVEQADGPDGAAWPIEPQDGERFTVTQQNNRLQVRR
jgi:uncharacterized protein YkwD